MDSLIKSHLYAKGEDSTRNNKTDREKRPSPPPPSQPYKQGGDEDEGLQLILYLMHIPTNALSSNITLSYCYML